jgi:FixJ family two-component response regulator
VWQLLEAGLPGAEIARRLGISKSTVSYHKRRLGHPQTENFSGRGRRRAEAA